MPWPDHYSIKQNPFIVGLQNYRDDLFKRFRVTPRTALPIFIAAVAFPGSIMLGAQVEYNARVAKLKADFPHQPPSIRDRWEERKRQHAEQLAQAAQAEKGEGAGEGGGEDGQEGGGDEE